MLVEVRSHIPPDVHIMAATATAKNETHVRSDKDTWYMDNPTVMSASPHKQNVIYWVLPKTSIEDIFGLVVKKLQELCQPFPRYDHILQAL